MAKADTEEARGKRNETYITATFDPAGAINGLEPLFLASNKWLENWIAVGSEMLEFGKSRLERNLEMSKAVTRSNGLDQAMDLQAGYARDLMRDYFSEVGKLADLGTRAMLDGLSAWQPGARGETTQRRAAAE